MGGRLREAGIDVFSLSLAPRASALIRGGRLMRLMRRLRPSLLQTWLYHADLLGLLAWMGGAAPALLWNIRCSYIDMRHYPIGSRLVRRVLPAMSGLPTRVVVNSEAGRLHHETLGYHPAKWELIPNGIDVEVFQPDPAERYRVRRELGIADDAVLVGMVARRDAMKDHATLLHAAAILGRSHHHVHVVLVGRGMEPGDPTFASSHVHLLGERTDMVAVNSSFDIATLSSIGEGFPNVIAEAMACGVPCVASDVGDVRWIIGETGRTVPARDPEALAAAWSELIEIGGAGRRALGRQARARIVEQFSLDRAVSRYEDLYHEVIGETTH